MVSNAGIDVDSMINHSIGVTQLIKLIKAGIFVLQLVSLSYIFLLQTLHRGSPVSTVSISAIPSIVQIENITK